MGEAANASAAFVTNETGSASMGTGPTSFRSTGSIGIGSFSHAATILVIVPLPVLMLLKLVLMDLLSSFPS